MPPRLRFHQRHRAVTLERRRSLSLSEEAHRGHEAAEAGSAAKDAAGQQGQRTEGTSQEPGRQGQGG